jgi:hypothetical protein
MMRLISASIASPSTMPELDGENAFDDLNGRLYAGAILQPFIPQIF